MRKMLLQLICSVDIRGINTTCVSPSNKRHLFFLFYYFSFPLTHSLHFLSPRETPDRRLSYVICSESARPSVIKQNGIQIVRTCLAWRRRRRRRQQCGYDPGAEPGQAGLYLAQRCSG